MADTRFFEIVQRYQAGDVQGAAVLAAQSADPFHQLIATYLQRVSAQGADDIYATPAGFTAFIRGGGNVPLYANLSHALRSIYEQHDTVRLLDIGVGDGLALLPALTDRDRIQQIDLVEPAADMLATTAAALQESQIAHTVTNESAETFITHADSQYDIAQATFCLHNLAADTRRNVFEWLRRHCQTFLLAEFDVQFVGDVGSAEHVDYLAERYRNGIAEYDADSPAVQQFLLPILFRNFDAGAGVQMHETTIDQWRSELTAAGFTAVQSKLLYRYWWADACLLIAT